VVFRREQLVQDLDFSSRDSAITVDRIGAFFEPSLQRVSTASGTLYRLQRLDQQPPGEGRSLTIFEINSESEKTNLLWPAFR
jgi:hypothetical protein